ncbi:hypothetical protein T11_7226 [Trichinella zimbabwensis]|uniref:DUF7041 domain-containing protein n=1 Tax=Trichinella zimbabwensis TaxID=268475 RepID=A0A0V1GYR1_9BILA|nr:hypothetical protein T11_7226 [Trichinella zimbabwensis]
MLSTISISQPQVWFEQVDAQLYIYQISTDTNMYYYVVSALHQDTACSITDFLRHLPATDKYKSIKALLTKRFRPSESERCLAAHVDILWQAKQKVLATINPLKTCQRSPRSAQKPIKVNNVKWCFYQQNWGPKGFSCRLLCDYPRNDHASHQYRRKRLTIGKQTPPTL